MAKPLLTDSREIIRRLETDGFILVSVRGSHHKYRHAARGRTVILPHPRKDIPIGTVRSIYRQAGHLMATHETHYVALIHKDENSGYGVSFPDVPGVVAVADTLDDAISEGAAALQFAFEDWNGTLPSPRTLDALQEDAVFQADAVGAVIAAIRPSYSYYAAAE